MKIITTLLNHNITTYNHTVFEKDITFIYRKGIDIMLNNFDYLWKRLLCVCVNSTLGWCLSLFVLEGNEINLSTINEINLICEKNKP